MSIYRAFRAAGVSEGRAKNEAPLAAAAMREFGITGPRQARFFLAQVLHESGGLQWFEELADGSAYEGRIDLGNTQPGDGRRFKGRGPIQLTGRANYRRCGKALGLDLEGNPKLASQHKVGWRIACWYWRHGSSHGDINPMATRGDFKAVTRAINGGLNGYADRVHYLGIMRRYDCRPTIKPPRTLYPGTSGPAVVKLKRLLRAKHYGGFSLAPPYREKYGDGTVAAVKRFQRKTKGLTPNGHVGPRTWAALDSRYRSN